MNFPPLSEPNSTEYSGLDEDFPADRRGVFKSVTILYLHRVSSYFFKNWNLRPSLYWFARSSIQAQQHYVDPYVNKRVIVYVCSIRINISAINLIFQFRADSCLLIQTGFVIANWQLLLQYIISFWNLFINHIDDVLDFKKCGFSIQVFQFIARLISLNFYWREITL